MNILIKRAIVIFVTVFLVVSIYNTLTNNQTGMEGYNPSYTRFISTVNNDGILKVVLKNINGGITQIRVVAKTGEEYMVNAPANDPQLINDLLKHKVDVSVPLPESRNIFFEIFINSIPVLLLIAVWIYVLNRQNPNRFGAGKSNAKLLVADPNNTTKFDDVAGCDEAKEEVREIVDFLKDPEKFNRLGGKIPRGILLTGEPGCGKTLLAKAIAHEAGVPFYSISGSDFVEMFVGVGASRVRNMFEEAKKNSPCIIFIDEIDAIGKSRSNAVVGNDERDQTLNALLVEMDGFDTKTGVIIIAATNRPEILDQALLRPGRFDREVTVSLPDVVGRKQILEVHSKGIPLGEDVDFSFIARGTSGFSGAELSNIVNEASILASREGLEFVEMKHFEKAKDKLLMGVERKSFLMSEEEKKMTAIHEAGHAVVGYFMPEHDTIYKVSIIPRGRALGITMFLPEKDTVSISRKKLEGQIASLYGGRIAEELFAGFDSITTGASNDIERATELASRMITEWGMSKKLPPIKYVEDGNGFMGGGVQFKSGMEESAGLVQKEIESLINKNYSTAEKLLKKNWDKVLNIADLLMEKETIDFSEIEAIMTS